MDSENKENIPPQHPAITPPTDPPTRPAPSPSATRSTLLASVVTIASAISTPQTARTTSASRHPTRAANRSATPASTTILHDETTESKNTIKKPMTKQPATIIQVYRQRVHSKNSTQKHAPIGPRGTVILSKDNPTLDKFPLKKGIVEPEKLKLSLWDTKGNLHKRFFPEKDEENWNDAHWISEANKWRNQVLRRMMKHDPTFFARGIRPKWGMRETNSLKAEIKEKVREVGNRRLTGQEWEEVTEAHNKIFAGTTLRAGERLIGGDTSKSAQDISKRTPVAIKALFERNNSLRAFYRELVVETEIKIVEESAGNNGGEKGLVDGSGDMESSDEWPKDEMDLDGLSDEEADNQSPSKKTDKGDRHGGEHDARLEDSSDDEDDNQRPASTQNGARLIACA